MPMCALEKIIRRPVLAQVQFCNNDKPSAGSPFENGNVTEPLLIGVHSQNVSTYLRLARRGFRVTFFFRRGGFGSGLIFNTSVITSSNFRGWRRNRLFATLVTVVFAIYYSLPAGAV